DVNTQELLEESLLVFILLVRNIPAFLLSRIVFFFFQAEDGIRDGHVTGVQTCALPICFKFNRITGAYIESPIVLSYSDNGGLTWTGPNRVGTPTQNIDQGSVPTPGPDGQVYVVFENYTGGTKAMVAASLDGGNTFAAAVNVDDIYEIPFPLKNSHYRGNSFPSIAGCTSGNLYVVWGDYRRGNADARFSRSVDGGLTWEPSFIVNSDLSTADHFFPWITSSPDNGLVHVAFLQRDDTPNNRLYNTWLATSTDLGASFGTQVLVSSGPSDPLFDAFRGFFIGH